MRFAESWKAVWEGRVLHISGTTDRFPNDWSTVSLRREDSGRGDATVRYTLEFHRDKEPDGQAFVEFVLPRRRFWW